MEKKSKEGVIASFHLKIDDEKSFYLTRTDVGDSKMIEIKGNLGRWYDKIWNLAKEFGIPKEKENEYWVSVAVQTKAYLGFLRLGDKHYKVYTPNEPEADFIFTENKEVIKDFKGSWVYKTTQK